MDCNEIKARKEHALKRKTKEQKNIKHEIGTGDRKQHEMDCVTQVNGTNRP